MPWPTISTRDDRELSQQVTRALLEPGTAGRRADHSAKLPPCRLNVKVERGPTCTFSRELPYVTYILFTWVKFTCARRQWMNPCTCLISENKAKCVKYGRNFQHVHALSNRPHNPLRFICLSVVIICILLTFTAKSLSSTFQ